MEMSKAAAPARYGRHNDHDVGHPLFPLYQQYRSSMSAQLVDSSDFRDWLSQYELSLVRDNAAKHPRYPEFLGWMQQNKGGARKCPAGDYFPQNFHFWLEGGRW